MATEHPPGPDGSYLRSATAGREVPDKAPYPEVLKQADRRVAKVRP